MASFDERIEVLKRDLARRNLERLSAIEPPQSSPAGPITDSDPCQLGLDILKAWSKKNMTSIKKSITQQSFLQKQDLDYGVAYLPFMESMAVYLRDWGKIQAAWQTFYDVNTGAAIEPKDGVALKEDAIDSYLDAQSEIDELAQMWNMKFIQICDLIKEPPTKPPADKFCGPYCGIFITTEEQKNAPFIGLAFKGTNPLNKREVAVDYDYDLTTAPSTYLGGKSVSSGVFAALFSEFASIKEIAYQFIAVAVNGAAKALPGINPPLHVTGHSLGGSYSSFAYAQLLFDAPNLLPKPYFTMGDEYTFGAPRVGSRDWAKYNGSMVSKSPGLTYRIVNNNDLVPQVPPTTLKKDQTDFFHVDSGFRIYSDKAPTTIDSEINGEPPKPYPIPGTLEEFIKLILNGTDHLPNKYESAMEFAIASQQ